jgi:hypothetical protein
MDINENLTKALNILVDYGAIELSNVDQSVVDSILAEVQPKILKFVTTRNIDLSMLLPLEFCENITKKEPVNMDVATKRIRAVLNNLPNVTKTPNPHTARLVNYIIDSINHLYSNCGMFLNLVEYDAGEVRLYTECGTIDEVIHYDWQECGRNRIGQLLNNDEIVQVWISKFYSQDTIEQQNDIDNLIKEFDDLLLEYENYVHNWEIALFIKLKEHINGVIECM